MDLSCALATLIQGQASPCVVRVCTQFCHPFRDHPATKQNIEGEATKGVK